MEALSGCEDSFVAGGTLELQDRDESAETWDIRDLRDNSQSLGKDLEATVTLSPLSFWGKSRCVFFSQKSWLKLVSAVIINNSENFYGVYFCSRYCSKYFTYINILKFPINPMMKALYISPYILDEKTERVSKSPKNVQLGSSEAKVFDVLSWKHLWHLLVQAQLPSLLLEILFFSNCCSWAIEEVPGIFFF